MNTALIIIYNHRYDQNIDILECIYKNRFHHIYHLVPFYNGGGENVIPVYENSYYFQGYVAQGLKNIKREYKHYIFIADDLILNPTINENNYASFFKLDEENCFLPRLSNIPQYPQYWIHNRNALRFNPFKTNGVEITNILPSKETASKKLMHFGIQNTSFPLKSVYNIKNIFKTIGLFFFDKFVYGISLKKGLKYPLVRSYSDIFIISNQVVNQFAQYCGVFSATDLFVELAIPTSIVLSSNTIITEKDLDIQGRALWTEEDYKVLELYKNDLNLLLQNFPNNIYLHPIKLSKWNTQNL
jgi:hypothetical protein